MWWPRGLVALLVLSAVLLSCCLGSSADASANAGDTGCSYRCPGGAQPVPRSGFRPTSNGCGSDEFQMDTSHMPAITSCCNEHDICYGTCNTAKSLCESRFKSCLIKACEDMRSGGHFTNQLEYMNCKSTGRTFYNTVLVFGCAFYRQAQAEACQCSPKQGRDGKATSGHNSVINNSSVHEEKQLSTTDSSEQDSFFDPLTSTANNAKNDEL